MDHLTIGDGNKMAAVLAGDERALHQLQEGEQGLRELGAFYDAGCRTVCPPVNVAEDVQQGKWGKATLEIGFTLLPGDEFARGLFQGAKELGRFEVGPYKLLREVAEAGLDAHHVGQKSIMKQFIPGYDLETAPSILVPRVGHTVRGANGVVSRSTKGLKNARDVVARDVRELRRVYPDVPNAQLQELIQMNKDMYPQLQKP